MGDGLASRFRRRFGQLALIGRDADTGGLTRLAWTREDAAARDWFRREAGALGLRLEQDRNANLWAWWGDPGGGAVVTGSHLDTVPAGGAYDGALGVVSALAAVERLQLAGRRPRRPVAVTVFADEEGGRFDTPTFGSGLLTGVLHPRDLLGRRDANGVALADAMTSAGYAPGTLGADAGRLATVGAVVELHVEQGRALADLGAAIAVGSGIRPHGRWRLDATGEANHAGTTRMGDRRDPMRVLAAAIVGARDAVAGRDAVATVGKVAVSPNGANAVPGHVTAWLDARAVDDATLDALVAAWSGAVRAAGDQARVGVAVTPESRSRGTGFDATLIERISGRLTGPGGPPPALPTAAGHDAGVLAAASAAMLFVRNPTGISHSPRESAAEADCVAGVRALAAVLDDLACA